MQEMQNLFTYAPLGTLAGAIAATVLVVNLIKKVGPLKRLSTRCLVVVVAEGIVFFTNLAAGSLTIINVPLCILNGLLLAAFVGSFQIIHDRLTDNSVNTKGGKILFRRN